MIVEGPSDPGSGEGIEGDDESDEGMEEVEDELEDEDELEGKDELEDKVELEDDGESVEVEPKSCVRKR